MIELSQVFQEFGQRTVLADINFSLGCGVTGLLGPNGAGKTTTLRLVAGYMAPTRGIVRVLGADPLLKETRREIGYLPEGAPLPPDLTVSEILSFTCRIRQIGRSLRARELNRVMKHLDLHTLCHRNAEALSKGQRRRVALAAALIGDPRVLVLDEPTDGLDPNQRDEVHDMIRQWSADRTVLISTHILDEAEQLCDQALVLAHGRLVARGTPTELACRATQGETVRIELINSLDANPLSERLRGLDTVSTVKATARHDALLVLAKPGMNPFTEIAGIAAREAWPIKGIHRQSVRLEGVFKALTQTDQSL